MKQMWLGLALLSFLPFASTEAASKVDKNPAQTTDWTSVMEAIIEVESHGNAAAKSGNSVGAMQITPILVKECNQILQKRGKKQRYTLQDRLSVQKSKEMFLLIQSERNADGNVERAIRAWNGGPRYSVKATNNYYNKVMRALAKLEK
jgi:hypothetical protein